ncbi:Uncharacterised protein [Bordetella pertussis]|nr:Uncharacterised protein [Bordetella pertussis]CFO73919.1 Uncharacterised protein [Bordetella pertussis]CFU79468.1 Uncharacterised protein [Bordetella pertussis]CPO91486.1 Uncharacterised protein [Bordetella pertussis]
MRRVTRPTSSSGLPGMRRITTCCELVLALGEK